MRDFNQEMSAWINKSLPTGDWIASDVALSIIVELEVSDPELLEGWSKATATRSLVQQISQLRLGRARQAHQKPPSAFSQAVNDPDPEALSVFAQSLVVSLDNTARRIGEMTAEDCKFVADRHGSRAKHHLFEQSFYNALSNKIPPDKTVEDVLSEEEYMQLRNSLTL